MAAREIDNMGDVQNSSRLKLTIAYDGGPFSGWQSQPNKNGVQDHLKQAFYRLLSAPTVVHGAGRTDAGVHALGQVAHVDVPSEKFTLATWVAALNANLPPEIRVMRCQFAARDFHARYSAIGKTYRYRVWNNTIMQPLEIGRCWHLPYHLDRDVLSEAAARFRGSHDFASFSAGRGKPDENTIRTIQRIDVHAAKGLIILDFEGAGFLYRMVRMLVGSIVRVASGKEKTVWIDDLLQHPGIGKSGYTAPAEGLYLLKVKY
jgi:tRNA pseudouridine38-40 synthase